MTFTFNEKLGITDLLQTQEANIPILIQLAKSVTKNVMDIGTTQEALDVIFVHIPDCATLLSKRAITREILFKYLHSKNVPVQGEFTKTLLVRKVTNFWNNNLREDDNSSTTTKLSQQNDHGFVNEEYAVSPSTSSHSFLNFNNISTNTEIPQCEESEFPINLLARKFSEWFFNNYNQNQLKPHDFWSDSHLQLRIAANDGCDEHECLDSSSLLDTLSETRQRFQFFFNPNLTHAGVQGRMNVHGLVVVLSCGTLHTANECVGLFECSFGLLRDPYSDNNWKTKTMQLMLCSKGIPNVPSLEESDTLKNALTLPVPKGEIT